MHPEPSGLYIAAMRYLWIAGVAAVAALGAGCSTVSSSPTTTTAGHHSTATTSATGSITPGPKDKTACASFKQVEAAGTSVTHAEIKSTLKELRHSENKTLRYIGTLWGGAVEIGKTSKANTDKTKIADICSRMGLG
jgi:hypothetical protein